VVRAQLLACLCARPPNLSPWRACVLQCELQTSSQQAAIEATESILLAVGHVAAQYGGIVLNA
jgi:hypothetical protein